MLRYALRIMFYAALLAALGCVQNDLDAEAQFVELDRAYFDCKVQPVLTKYCSAFACHGDGRRYYRIYARNRLRRGGTEQERNAFMREAEREANFIASRVLIDQDNPRQSIFLLKPLQQSAGGYYHGGETKFGQGDVFADREDPDFKILERWVMGESDDPNCIEPGSDR